MCLCALCDMPSISYLLLMLCAWPSELVYGVKVTIAGDLSHLQSPCLIIVNHRTRFDWLFLWCYLLRKGNLSRMKIILSKKQKHLPLFGKFYVMTWLSNEESILAHSPHFFWTRSVNVPWPILYTHTYVSCDSRIWWLKHSNDNMQTKFYQTKDCLSIRFLVSSLPFSVLHLVLLHLSCLSLCNRTSWLLHYFLVPILSSLLHGLNYRSLL